MTEERTVLYSGGCQCGAVRYALYAEPFDSHICHCRMCQKAFGAFYAPLTLIGYEDFAWTRGTPATFRSSPEVERGFCPACGTPLTFARRGASHFDIAIGSLDEPERIQPQLQIGVESRISWTAELPGLPERTTEQGLAPEPLAAVESYQHPDRDTASWPPKRC